MVSTDRKGTLKIHWRWLSTGDELSTTWVAIELNVGD
jgi:hypothetical protein